MTRRAEEGGEGKGGGEGGKGREGWETDGEVKDLDTEILVN